MRCKTPGGQDGRGRWAPWRMLAIAMGLCLSVTLWLVPQPSAIARTLSARATDIQPYLDRVDDQITEFTLDNGIRFIVMERHQAPVVSFMIHFNVGAAEEEDGKTGAAHYLEHLAFKGTSLVGTSDYEAERPLLDQLDELFDQILAARAAGDIDEETRLQAEFDAVQEEAATYVNQNEFGRIVEEAGGVGLNATTSADATRYFYSLPANKLELWMSLESERFLDPVFREFYEEKDVILEERRMRTDNSPVGKMIEAFLETSFPDYIYGRPVIGYEDDLRNMTRDDIYDFYTTHYTPRRMTVTLVGDVDPREVRQLARIYFSRYPDRPNAPDVVAELTPQTEPRDVTLYLNSEPWYLEGYHRPDLNHPDHAVYTVINGILTYGRTSRLYKSLVQDGRIALDMGAADGFPGDRFPNLVLFYGLTAPGHTVDEIKTAMNQEFDRLRTEPVTADELDRVKTQSLASLVRSLSSNQGMASLLASYQAKTGSWRNLFSELDAINQVTAEDVMRVSQAMFRPDNVTTGRILPLAEQEET
ncbi:MAG: pitrilysin family protein [Elainellaceae cyanobacterium]